MGESFTTTLSSTNAIVNGTQPTLAIVNEDDDEPPSSGPHLGRSSQITGGEGAHRVERSVDASGAVFSRDYAIETIPHGHALEHQQTFDTVIDDVEKKPRHGITASDLEKFNKEHATARRKKIRVVRVSKMERIRALFTPSRPVGNPSYYASLKAVFFYTPLSLLLILIPVSWALHFTHQNATIVFVTSALAIIPLAALLGLGTEQIALRTSQSIGGLLNASLGNLIELIISGIALKHCELELIQSALLGGILSNLLLVLGGAFIIGGFRFHHQEFQPMVAQLNSSLLIVGVISLVLPQALHQYLSDRLKPNTELDIMLQLSRGSAVLLIIIYIAYLIFQFYSHNHLFHDTLQTYTVTTSSRSSRSSKSSPSDTLDVEFDRNSTRSLPMPATSSRSSSSSESEEELEMAKMNGVAALILLAVVTIFAYLTAEHLVASLEGMVEANPKVSKEWITLIIIPIISNAAEHTTALIVARKGKFDLAMSVAVGSCIQIAFLVIPILILVAWGMGKPLTLLFDPMETVVLFFSVLVVKFSVEDGKSHWMSGLVLISVYVLTALTFWYFPGASVTVLQGVPLTCAH